MNTTTKKALKIAAAVAAVTAVAIGVGIGVTRNKNTSLRSATVSASQAQAFTAASGGTSVRASFVDGLTSDQMDKLMEAIDQGAQEYFNTEPGTVQLQFGSGGPAPLTESSTAGFSSSLDAVSANGGSSKAAKGNGYTIIKEANDVHYSDVIGSNIIPGLLGGRTIYRKKGVAVVSLCIPNLGAAVVVYALRNVESLGIYGEMMLSTTLPGEYGPGELFVGLAYLNIPAVDSDANEPGFGAVEFRSLPSLKRHAYIGWEGESFISYIGANFCILAGTFHIED